jgi:hypothetical protein
MQAARQSSPRRVYPVRVTQSEWASMAGDPISRKAVATMHRKRGMRVAIETISFKNHTTDPKVSRPTGVHSSLSLAYCLQNTNPL